MLLEAIGIEEVRQPRIDAQAEVMAALGADPQVFSSCLLQSISLQPGQRVQRSGGYPPRARKRQLDRHQARLL